MGPLTQLFAHQLKQLRKFIDVHDQLTYPFPLKAGNNSSSETQRGRYLLGGEGKSKRAGKCAPLFPPIQTFSLPQVRSLRSVAVLVGRAQVIKAGEGRETARRLRREQRETASKDGGLFWVVRTPAYGSFRLDQNVRPSIKYLVISNGRVPRDWTNHLRKTKSKY